MIAKFRYSAIYFIRISEYVKKIHFLHFTNVDSTVVSEKIIPEDILCINMVISYSLYVYCIMYRFLFMMLSHHELL